MAVFLVGCSSNQKQQVAEVTTGGNIQRGAAAITHYGCGSCHTIPGISGANGMVGPPLTGIGERVYIAGMLQNTPRNLVTWIKDPHGINPKTLMPNMGVTEQDARDIAGYLYNLK